MSLPIDSVMPDVLTALAGHTAVVLQAPPGAGKTTRVPTALLTAPWLAGKKILMLEPRRIAARAAATFMAAQLGEAAGQTVGYRTRQDSRVSATTRVEVVTEGVLTRMIQRDPSLDGYGIVIFDEFHERSLQADLGLALVAEVQQALREDLRLLVMSATLDGERIASLLSGNAGTVPIVISAGRQHPVTVSYSAPGRTPWLEHMAAELLTLARQPEAGSILAFLPGSGEIRRLASALEGKLPADMQLAPLYGDLTAAEQDAAIAPAPAGQRKLVLASAIAETSLTIEGIRTVVDAGFDRRPVFDPGSGMTRLETVRVSAASADQRAGRAGRLGSGHCVRLWPQSERLAPFARAEILDADLAGLVLELAQWGCRQPADLLWLDVPPSAAWQQALSLLQQLEALDSQGAITEHGRALLALPLPPRLAHMVQRGRELGAGELAAQLAVLLSERDVLRDAGVDISLRLEALKSGQGIERGRLAFLRQSVQRLLAGAPSPRPNTIAAQTVLLPGDLLALAFPDRVAKRRPGGPARFLMRNGRGAVVANEDALAGSEWLVIAHLDGNAREARVFLAAPITLASIETLFAEQIVEQEEGGWDGSGVRGWRRRRLGALVLEEKAVPLRDPQQLSSGMIEGVRTMGLDCLPWHEDVQQWRARVNWMAKLEPEHWPLLSDDYLLDTLEQWLAPWLAGISTAAQLKNVPLNQALQGLLDESQRKALARELPASVSVPTGSQIRIDYDVESGPVLAVKLQEMFGMQQGPVLAGGRLPLTIHLLSPARRPVAVTSDLASFWRQGYPEVRRELRGRYPKHPWPEDPITATPQRGVKRPTST